ncbi:hypothetical protein Cni_G16484 [Canna indica]|uniref:RNase H type-1 domain-containing protein n=1 Tax=Canna indica TaxID=4628 RepID=A0AAQ3KFE9_9LILI|nr:hypothetical protein Cni_G16484 [Canna indica]
MKHGEKKEDHSHHEHSYYLMSRSPPRLSNRFKRYTPLNTSRETILQEVHYLQLLRPPGCLESTKSSYRGDKSKRCEFHHTFGHTTEECVVLRDQIERLIRECHLDHYIRPSYQPHQGHSETPQLDSTVDDHNPEGIDKNLHDPVVISVFIVGFLVRKVLVDQRSSADVLFYLTLERMGISETSLHPYHGELVNFSVDRVNVKGRLRIATTFSSTPITRTINIQFLVVHCTSPYNMILDRPSLNNLGAMVSTHHLAIKFPISETEVGVIHADQREAHACYNECLKLKSTEPQPKILDLDPKGDIQERPQPVDDLDPIQIGTSPEQVTYIGAHIPNELKAQALADLFIEFTNQGDTPNQREAWTLFVDGTSNEKRRGAGIILENGQGIALEQSLLFQFKANNNQAEYEALIPGLKLAQEVKARSIIVKSDS